jgi:hypothetical protein
VKRQLLMLFTCLLPFSLANAESASPVMMANVGDVVAHQAGVTQQMSADDLCYMLAGKLGSVKRKDCVDRGFVASGAYSVSGKPIIYKEYPPLEPRTPLGRVMLIGGIHGDEYSSISIVFKWMKTLDRYHSGLFHWRVIPVLNPDGLLRKRSQRMNHNGVDLNRNFPTPDWEVTTEHYWVNRTKKNPRRYPGPSALSEPESQWLSEEIARFKPDVIVSVHAPYGILDFDGPKKAPSKLGQLHLNLLGTYPGSLGNYAGVQNEIPVVTIELPYAGILPSKQQTRAIWRDLVRWLRGNVVEEIHSPQVAASESSSASSIQ